MGKISSVVVGAALAVGALFGCVAATIAPPTTHLSRPGVYCVEESDCAPQYSGVTNRMIIRHVTP